MSKIATAVFFVLVAAAGPVAAQSNVAAQCGGTSGKTFACCKKVVTANPTISQCAKERAVFECTGSKKYVSSNGCGTFTK